MKRAAITTRANDGPDEIALLDLAGRELAELRQRVAYARHASESALATLGAARDGYPFQLAYVQEAFNRVEELLP